MSKAKKLFSLLLVLVMAVGLFGSLSLASAATVATDKNPVANDMFGFKAVRSGDNITYTVYTVADITGFGGIEGTLAYGDGLEFVSEQKLNGLTGDYYDVTKIFSLFKNDDYAANTNIWAVTLKVTDGFQESTDYALTFVFKDAFDVEYNTYDWSNDSYEVVYRENPDVVKHNVNFISNGANVGTVEVVDGETVSRPADPTRDGYTFVEWQLNGVAYDFTKPVTTALTLTAKWAKDASTAGDNTVDLSGVTISKTVSSSATVTAEAFEFDLVFDADKSSVPAGTTAPSLGPVYINTADTGSVNLADEVEFPEAGVYVYKVSEKAGSTAGMTYDTNSYYLVITIEETDEVGTLGATYVKIYDKDMAQKSDDDMSFTNVFNKSASLKVTKEVDAADGAPAYDKEFTFTLTLTPPAVYDETKSVTATIGGEEVTIAYNSPYEFTMKDGDEIVFNDIAEGTTYTLTETGTQYYKASAAVVKGQSQETKSADYGEDLTVTQTIGSNNNIAAFTNTYSITPDTGVTVSSEMIVIGLLAVLALTGGFMISRKFRKVED